MSLSPWTSKWNKIEHRLFSFISMNWRGQPLVSYEAVVNLIGGTRTRSGLKVKATLDTRSYEKVRRYPLNKSKNLISAGTLFIQTELHHISKEDSALGQVSINVIFILLNLS